MINVAFILFFVLCPVDRCLGSSIRGTSASTGASRKLQDEVGTEQVTIVVNGDGDMTALLQDAASSGELQNAIETESSKSGKDTVLSSAEWSVPTPGPSNLAVTLEPSFKPTTRPSLDFV